MGSSASLLKCGWSCVSWGVSSVAHCWVAALWAMMTLTSVPPQVSRRLLSKPQDALEGVVLSVSGAALGWGMGVGR